MGRARSRGDLLVLASGAEPAGIMAVQPAAIRAGEVRSLEALDDGQADHAGGALASGTVTTLPRLRVITRVR
jgi:hypothetical protein